MINYPRFLMIIDNDWGLAPIEPVRGRDLLEILDDRFGRRPAIVTSQLPVGDWHRQLEYRSDCAVLPI